MQNFKTFYKIVWQKRMSFIIYLSVFIALCVVFTMMKPDGGESKFTNEQYSIAVFDYDKTVSSQAFVDYLSSIHEIVEVEDDVDACKEKLFSRTVECVIYITDGYEESLKNGSIDGVLEYMSIPESVYASTITSQADQYIRLLQVQLAGGNTIEEALKQVDVTMKKEADVRFMEADAKAEYSNVYYAFLYQPYVILCVSISTIGMALMVFRNRRLADRIRCSSYKFTRQNGDILLASMSTEAVLALIFLILAFFVGGNYLISNRGIFYILNVLVFSAFSLSVAFCVTMIGVRTEAITMIGTVSGLAIAFLGGIFVPMEYFGDSLMRVVRLVPSYWYVNVLRIMEQGDYIDKLPDLFLSIGIQVGYAAVFVAIGLVMGKVKRQ